MKKTLSLLALLFTFFLVACSNTTSDNTKSSSSEKVSMVEVVLTPLEEEQQSKEVKISSGDTALDTVKKAYEVEEKDGFITSIDGKSQDENNGIYWMFKVNGEDSSKGAGKVSVKDGDKIEFYQQSFN
ncbi:DUF4430 domain-containing protein [Streptococcus pluranimalium]|uniref:DUF4430 domain-containing protein n=1 Tax=Streptococcus pluranimalium TaxID=82348 RepID=UPI003F68CC23